MFVKTLVAQATIDRFHKAILLRFAWRVLTPSEDSMTGEFEAVVADHHARHGPKQRAVGKPFH